MGSNAEYAQMSQDAGWEYGFRSIETPKRTDVRMIDIDWKRPRIDRHLAAIALHRPWVAVCPDVVHADQWPERLELAREMHALGARHVMIVPKVTPWMLPSEPWVILGYPVGIGEGSVCPFATKDSNLPIHLLGGTITGQLRAMYHLPFGQVVSGDMNAHTKAARFGGMYGPNGRHRQSAVTEPEMTGKERVTRNIRYSFFGIRTCWDHQSIDVSERWLHLLDDRRKA